MRLLKRIYCWFRGHDPRLESDSVYRYVACRRCGYLESWWNKAGPMMLLALLLTVPLSAQTLTTTVTDVYDGDSITVKAFRLLVSENGAVILEERAKVRVCCMDTPELGWRAKCDSERLRAIGAKKFAQVLIGQEVVLHVKGLEKYGRVLARVELPGGSMMDEEMIRLGAARPYEGEARDSWCDNGGGQ